MSDVLSATDFDFEAQRLNDLASQQAWGLDKGLHVQFYKHAELNSFRTQEAGRKIFDEHVYIRILMPANRLNVIERRATEEDKTRFAAHYTRFLQGAEQLQTGTQLSELPGLTAAQVLEFRALKVDTVEQLAALPDTTVSLIGVGGQMLKQQAIRFLDARANSLELSQEVRDLKEELEGLRRQMREAAAAAATASAQITVTDSVAPKKA